MTEKGSELHGKIIMQPLLEEWLNENEIYHVKYHMSERLKKKLCKGADDHLKNVFSPGVRDLGPGFSFSQGLLTNRQGVERSA